MKLSSKAQRALAALEDAKRKWDRVHSLLEKAAIQPAQRETFQRQAQRTAEDVGRLFANAGLGALAASANEFALTVKRPGNFQPRLGSMRDMVASVFGTMDRTAKAVNRGDFNDDE